MKYQIQSTKSKFGGAVAGLLLLCSLAHAAWQQALGGPDDDLGTALVLLPGGEFVVAGYTNSFGAGGYDVLLARVDADGQTVWLRALGTAADELGESVARLPDGGFIVAGQAGTASGMPDLLLVRTDSTGAPVWQRTLGGAGLEVGYGVALTADRGFAVAGITTSLGDTLGDAWLCRTDSLGNLLWQRALGGNQTDWAHALLTLPDQGFIVAGATSSLGAGSFDMFLVRTDSLGNVLWQKTFGGTDWDVAYDVTACTGGWALAGGTKSGAVGSFDVYLVRTDSTGDRVWESRFGDTDQDHAYALVHVPGRGFGLAGRTGSFGARAIDAYFVQTDESGALVRQTLLGGYRDDQAYAIAALPDRGYLLAGSTRSFGAGERDVYLVRTDSLGYAPGVEEEPAAPGSGPVRLDARPNPFHGAVKLLLRASVPGTGLTPPTVTICDAAGRTVRTLRPSACTARPLAVVWDGTDAARARVPAGIYFACTGSPEPAVARLVLLR